MKLAPRLKHFLALASLPCRPDGAWTKESGELWAAADAELRALLAVARTAKASLCGRIQHPPTPLNRALARLEKVSAR